MRAKFIIFGLLAGALFTGIVGTLGAHFVWELMAHRAGLGRPRTAEVDRRTCCIPLGSYLMCFRFLQVCWGFIRTGDLPHADHAHVEGLDKEDRRSRVGE